MEKNAQLFWNCPLVECLAELGATSDGQTTASAAERRRRFGPNQAVAFGRPPLIVQFFARFRSPLVIVLLVASVLSALTGEVASFVIITTVVLLSVTLDFIQELQAERTVEALRRSVALRVSAKRDGAVTQIPAVELVPGDIVLLSAGDLVPADGRILDAKDLFVNQALLTGESYPAEKHPTELATPVPDLQGATNALFMGSSVISGTATVLICRIGRATAFGGLASTILSKPPATAFELGIRRFGALIVRVTVLLVLFVLLINLLLHRPLLESFLFALALAVGLTPELLPMITTVTLSRGALRLARRHVIVKRLAAIHNLGAMDVLCTDKTGTLTEAQIKLARHVDAFGNESERVFELAYLNSAFETGLKSPLDEAVLAHRTLDCSAWRKLDEVPFDFTRRRVSVLLAKETQRLLIVKGAPEDVLRLSTRCEGPSGGLRPLDDDTRAKLVGQFEGFGSEGFRTLAVALREVAPGQDTAVLGDESELVFSGFAAFLDPPKVSAANAVRQLADSGVTVKILTGDNERVTRHLCTELGFPIARVITGDELSTMSDEALYARVASTNLFCRVTPQQKLRVLLALKRRGSVVGFLGDGINDAPSLHAADVGISVDGAADVAKEAADMILLEHDLSVMHDAVAEGRRTFANVMKYILMATSSNFGNMFSMAGAALLLPFLPMLPVQILLNNLLYDFSEIGIPFDRVDSQAMARPRHWDMRLITRFMLIIGPISSLFDFLTFFVMLHVFNAGEALFQTGWFVESMATQVLVIFLIRTQDSVFSSRPHPLLAGMSVAVVAVAACLPFTPIGAWFGLVPLPATFFAALAVMVVGYLALVEVAKRFFYKAKSAVIS